MTDRRDIWGGLLPHNDCPAAPPPLPDPPPPPATWSAGAQVWVWVAGQWRPGRVLTAGATAALVTSRDTTTGRQATDTVAVDCLAPRAGPDPIDEAPTGLPRRDT